MSAIRGVAFQLWAVEGGDAALNTCQRRHLPKDTGKRTHMVVACPQQFLGRVERERGNVRSRMMGSGRRQLSYCQLRGSATDVDSSA